MLASVQAAIRAASGPTDEDARFVAAASALERQLEVELERSRVLQARLVALQKPVSIDSLVDGAVRQSTPVAARRKAEAAQQRLVDRAKEKAAGNGPFDTSSDDTGDSSAIFQGISKRKNMGNTKNPLIDQAKEETPERPKLGPTKGGLILGGGPKDTPAVSGSPPPLRRTRSRSIDLDNPEGKRYMDDTAGPESPARSKAPPSPLMRNRSSNADVISSTMDAEFSKAKRSSSREANPSRRRAATVVDPPPDARELARQAMRDATKAATLERLDSVRRIRQRDQIIGAQADKPTAGSPSPREGKTTRHLIDQFSYLLARGDVRKVKKNVVSMLSKSSTRKELFLATDKLGQSVLHLAVLGCGDLIKPLAEKGMPLDGTDVNGWTALSCAALRGDERVFKQLLSFGAKPDAQALHFFTNNFCSIETAPILDQMLAAPARSGGKLDLNAPAPNSITKDTPLHSAVSNPRENLLEDFDGASLLCDVLLRRAADPNIPNAKGDYPLHWSVLTGNVRCCKLLIVGGSDISVKNAKGQTPEALAEARAIESGGESKILKVLSRSREALGILESLDFGGAHSDESFAQIFRAFVAEEVGINAFLGQTTETLRQMGVKHASSVAVLIQQRDSLKEHKATRGTFGIPSIDFHESAVKGGPGKSSVRSQSILRRAASSANMRKGIVTKRSGSREQVVDIPFGTRRLGKKADASSQSQLKHNFPLPFWMDKLPIGLEIGTRPKQALVSMDPSKVKLRKVLDDRLSIVKLEKKAGHPRLEGSPDCLFMSAAEQLLASPDQAQELRGQTAAWLRKNKKFKVQSPNSEAVFSLNSRVATTSWANYCDQTERTMWGDAISLVAISEIFGCRIFVVSSCPGNLWAVWITPTKLRTPVTVLLSHLAELHFAPLQHSFNRSVFDIANAGKRDGSVVSNDDVLVPISDVELGLELSQGRRGITYKATWKGVDVVAKRLSSVVVSSDAFTEIRGEIGMLKRLRHPHVLLFLACAESIATIPDVLLLHEYMSRGSLSDWLGTDEAEKNFGSVLDADRCFPPNSPQSDRAWNLRVKLASDIASGLHYLHSMGIVHRSFSSDHVLLDKALHAKVGGFGMAKIFEGVQGDMFGSSLAFTPPEVFNAVPLSKLVDVYAFGIVLWHLMARVKPYSVPRELGSQEIIIGVAQGTLRPPLPSMELGFPPYVDLLEACWSHQQSNRPTFDTILVSLQDISTEIRTRASQRRVQQHLFDGLLGLSEGDDDYTSGGNSGVGTEDENGGGVPSDADPSSTSEAFNPNYFWQIDFRDLVYDEADRVGEGRSSTVFRGRFRGHDVAIKVLKEHPETGLVSAENKAEFQKELEVLSVTRTPALVYFFGATLGPKMTIITEYMEAGTLYERMQDRSRPLTWVDVIRYATHTAKACNALHTWKPPVVHRDIKSSNLLLDSLDNVKLCDLGLARFAVPDQVNTLRKSVGTPKYMGPEIYMYSLADDNAESRTPEESDALCRETLTQALKSDVFSYAIVLWELLMACFVGTYKTPYFADNKSLLDPAILIKVAKHALRPKMQDGMPESLVELVRWCWSQEPSKRPNFATVILTLKQIKKEYKEKEDAWNRMYAEVRTIRVTKAQKWRRKRL